MATDTGTSLTWGVLPEGALDRVLVCSPHFDDAAMGAGHLLCAHPGSTVVTVFGGPPSRYPDPPTEWDALGGFQAGDDVVALRREEDRDALAVLDAEQLWLEFVDHQYLAPAERVASEVIARELGRVIDDVRPTAVFLPMGLANPDHVATHDAGMLLAARREDLAWFCYEDAGYKHLPGMLAWRIGRLFRGALWPTPMIVPIDTDDDRKRTAIERYASQVPPLERDHALSTRLDGHVPEQFWLLAPPPPGWEGLRDR